MRILVAEDDLASRQILNILLKEWQFEAVLCTNGTDAWDVLQSDEAPPLAILDWMLPGIDGLELCRRVRRLRPSPLPYIIFLTARTQKSDMVRALDEGVDDFLVKPFDHEELRARLQVGTRLIALQERLVEHERAARQRAEDLARHRSHQLTAANEQLEERQAQLIHSEKMAALGMLAAGVAHELNNPIGYIRGNFAVLREYAGIIQQYLQAYADLEAAARAGAAGDQALARLDALRRRDDVGYILNDLDSLLRESHEGADRLIHIVGALKNLGRADEDEMRPTDLNAELETALRVAGNELKYKAKVHRDLGPLDPILCYPVQLNQVFTNLLVNAAQAIPNFGEVRVSSRQEDGEVVIRVADTGQGIADEQLPHIFEAFYTTKKIGEGTGLGLSVSRAIVEKHRGSIAVDSRPGQGTTFTIRLPQEPPPAL